MVNLNPRERSDSHRNHAMDYSLVRVRRIVFSETFGGMLEYVVYHDSNLYHSEPESIKDWD